MSDVIKQATKAQFAASNPMISAFVSANAGSGKTRVLTQRIARLLLRDVDPARILCLTFTKAAAGEVQNRIFGDLSKWVLLNDADLSKALAEVGEAEAINSTKLASARRLFAKALETPGGLKVQTIHAFATSVLKRFPLEAKVPPSFKEMGDQDALALLSKAREEVIANDPSKALVYARELPMKSEKDWLGILSKIAPVANIAEQFGAAMPDQLEAFLDQFETCFEDQDPAIESEMTKGVLDKWKTVKAAFAEGMREKAVEAMMSLVFTQDGEVASVVGKNDPAKRPQLGALYEEIVELGSAYRNALFWRRQEVFYEYAVKLKTAYQAQKSARSLLDYDDLILKCAALLNEAERLNWVMYRLDGGIDHILIDEAQDTNPVQWSIVDALVHQLASDASAHRTVFVVGDYKQSIFGFQGADSDVFLAKQKEYQDILSAQNRKLHVGQMNTSFRSSKVILDFVDRVFEGPLGTGVGEQIAHMAANESLSGAVELLPYYEIADDKVEKLWPNKIPQPVKNTETELARDLARRIAGELASGMLVQDGNKSRAVEAGDYLILTRSRTKIYAPLQKELQRLGVPIAGVDKLNLKDELAIKDIMSVLRFVQAPFDEFSLACFLKSPLAGLSDQDLFELTRSETSLYGAILASGNYPEIVEMIEYLRKHADFSRPFDLISSFFVRFDVVAKMSARLGPAVYDALDVFMDATLNYEAGAPASLSGFIQWFDSQDLSVKREFEEGINAVRVLSMHGAKGLEAPIVILPFIDSQDLHESFQEFDEGILYAKSDGLLPEALAEAKLELKRKSHDEERRLLYVGLTRARSRLVIACAGKPLEKVDGSDDLYSASSIYGQFEDALARTSGELTNEQDVQIVRYGTLPQTVAGPRTLKGEVEFEPEKLAGLKSAKGSCAVSEILSSYHATPENAGRGADFGTLVHDIIEHWQSATQHADPRMFFDRSNPDFEQAFVEVERLVGNFPELLAESTLFEVPFLQEVKGRLVSGRIDAVIVEEDRLRIVDFKSDTDIVESFAELSLRYKEQLAVYAHVLGGLYPKAQISGEIMWSFDGSRVFASANELKLVYNNLEIKNASD